MRMSLGESDIWSVSEIEQSFSREEMALYKSVGLGTTSCNRKPRCLFWKEALVVAIFHSVFGIPIDRNVTIDLHLCSKREIMCRNNGLWSLLHSTTTTQSKVRAAVLLAHSRDGHLGRLNEENNVTSSTPPSKALSSTHHWYTSHSIPPPLKKVTLILLWAVFDIWLLS